MAAEDLVRAHLDDARKVAISIRRRLPPFIELDDLVGQAYLGLWQAAVKYDPATGVPFWAYAVRRVQGAIHDSIRRKNFQHTSTLQLSESPEAVDALHYSDDAIQDLDSAAVAREVRAIVETADEQTRNVLKLRYWCGKNGKESGRAMGVGESRSSQLHHRALDAMRNSSHGRTLKELYMKTASKAAIKLGDARRAQLVDELGDIRKRLEQVKRDSSANIEREKQLKIEMLSWIPAQLGAAESTTFRGRKFVATVSAQKNERQIVAGGKKKIAEWLGLDTFFDKCNITLKVLEVMLTGKQMLEIVNESRTGPRSIEVQPIATAVAAPAQKAA